MDESGQPGAIDEALREVARTRAIAAALLHGADAVEVDDVLQEASVAALAPGAPRGEAFARWIRGAVRHLSVTLLRRRDRRRSRERAAARPVALPSTADVAHRLALQRVLLAEVEALAEPIRTAIVRRYLDGLPPRRIAKEQGVPLATVKTRLRRGLARLRERLNREWGEELGGSLLLLSRPVGVTAGGVAAAGFVVMTFKAKLAVAALLLAAAAMATIGLARHFSPVSDDSDFDAVAAAAANGAGPSGVSPTGATSATLGASGAERAAVPFDLAPPGSRLARLGPRRIDSLTGRVVDPRGRIVAGAAIEAVRSIGDVSRLADDLRIEPDRVDARVADGSNRTRSGRDGSFRFDELVRGATFDLFAQGKSGRRGVVRGVRAGFSDPIVIELQPVTTITGVVVDARDDRPVAGATVRIRNGSTDAGHPLVTKADGDGEFTFSGVVGNGVMVIAAAPDGRTSGPYTPRFSPGGHVTLRIEVGRAGAGQGEVVDAESGVPIADATILLAEWSDLVATHSDAMGHFQIRPAYSPSGGIIDVIIVAPGYARSFRRLWISKDADDPTLSAPFQLKRGLVATGRVEWRDGTPIGGAILVAGRAEKAWRTNGNLATTRADGSFRLEGIDAATHLVLLLRHDECEWLATPFPDDEATRTEIDFGTIRVGRGAVVAGVVADDGGTPLAGAYVHLTTAVGDGRGVHCDGNGSFEFDGVPAGGVKLRASVDGFAQCGELALDVEDEAILDAVQVAVPTGLTIAGRIVDVRGAPSVDAVVILNPIDAGGDANRDHSFIARSGKEGRFCIRGLDTGAYRLVVRPERRTETLSGQKVLERVDAGTSDLEVVLSDASFATGRVVDGAGEPIAGAFLTLAGADGKKIAGGHSGRDGSFRIEAPPDVDLRLDARVFDPRHPVPVMDGPVVASLDHVRADGPSVTLVIAKH